MKIQRFELVNFRGIERMSLEFSAQTTALVGVNGVGKSSVLDALAISLSNLTARITGQPTKARSMSMDEIRIGADFARLSTTAELDSSSSTFWAVALNRKAGKHDPERSSDLQDLRNHTDLLDFNLKFCELEKVKIDLPLAVYYDVHRAVLDVPLRVREKQTASARAAYSDALGHGGTDFKAFFIWFRAREDAENEVIRDKRGYRDRDLSAVRQAIEQFTQFTDLRIRRKPTLRMTVKKAGTELNVLQLSDGERCMLALVGDLARRLSLLNTKRVDPLQGEGVVLIDEIDLHLHPRWQRTVVASLERTFPNCQFIITTHSPQVIGELATESVMLLRDGSFLGHPERSLGLSSGEVLEELMEVQARNVTFQAKLIQVEHAIEDEAYVQARSILKDMHTEFGSLPEVLRLEESLEWFDPTAKVDESASELRDQT